MLTGLVGGERERHSSSLFPEPDGDASRTGSCPAVVKKSGNVRASRCRSSSNKFRKDRIGFNYVKIESLVQES